MMLQRNLSQPSMAQHCMSLRPTAGIEAILLDRDGVINRERKDYVKCWAEFEFLPGALAALQQLAAYPWPIIVVTNQSVVGRKLISEADLVMIHHQFAQTVYTAGGRIDAIFACPHPPEAQCVCRKPRPGLLLDAAQAFGVELTRCILIGDSLTDMQAAAAVGCAAILVNGGARPPAPGVVPGKAQGATPGATPGHMLTLPDLLTAATTILAAVAERLKVGN